MFEGIFLVSPEPGNGDPLHVTLYDLLGGKNALDQEFAAGSILMTSADSQFTAVVSPKGEVTVVDLAKRAPIAALRVHAEHLAGIKRACCFATATTSTWPYRRSQLRHPAVRRTPFSRGRAVPVNGWLYAFRRDNSKERWRLNMTNQFIMMDRFDESPLIVAAGAYPRGETLASQHHSPHSGRCKE